MEGKPARPAEDAGTAERRPPDGNGDGDGASPPDAGQDGGTERIGPLLLRRLSKDDGRALLVYSRAESET